MALKYLYLGSPDFAVGVLRALLQAGYRPEAVLSQPDKPRGRSKTPSPTPVKQLALAENIPVLTPARINTPEALAEIAAYQPDLLVVVAFGQLLKQELLDLPPLGVINLHGSLLPAYRGAAPIQRAIMNGETATGVTTMFLNLGMDTGDMILKQSCAIGPDETSGELHDQLMRLGGELLAQTMRLIEKGEAPRTPQDDALASYAPPLSKEEERLDFARSALQLHNHIRAFNPWPVTHTHYQDKRLKLWQTKVRESRFEAQPGQVVAVDRQGIWLATGEGELCLTELQPEGKGRMSACDFARGYGIKVGVHLGNAETLT